MLLLQMDDPSGITGVLHLTTLSGAAVFNNGGVYTERTLVRWRRPIPTNQVKLLYSTRMG